MRVPQDPLSEEETAEAQALLDEAGGKDLVFARGVFAAVATAPSTIDPPDWLTLLLGDQVPSASRLRRLLSLLMREYNACADCLALSVPAVPRPDDADAVTRFAKGYVQIAQKDAAWSTDADAFGLTVPLMMLSGYAQASALSSLAPEVAVDPEAYLAAHRSALTEDLVVLYDHFKEKREAKRQGPARAQEKIGRNDPCPCGSGKKYKKCCGAGD